MTTAQMTTHSGASHDQAFQPGTEGGPEVSPRVSTYEGGPYLHGGESMSENNTISVGPCPTCNGPVQHISDDGIKVDYRHVDLSVVKLERFREIAIDAIQKVTGDPNYSPADLLQHGALAEPARRAGGGVMRDRNKGCHLGDPCYFCGLPHDDVPVGPCPVASVVDADDLDVFVEFGEACRDYGSWDGYHVEDVRNMAATFLRVLRGQAMS